MNTTYGGGKYTVPPSRPSIYNKITRRRNAAIQALPLACNSWTALRSQHALTVYRRCPAAAYLAEILNAFRPQS
jgi:hypothetical protein